MTSNVILELLIIFIVYPIIGLSIGFFLLSVGKKMTWWKLFLIALYVGSYFILMNYLGL